MKIVIPGGSGQVGTLLARAFVAAGHEVVELGRRPRQASWRTVAWDAENEGAWGREIDGADVVIGLAGRSVDCRYTAANRRASGCRPARRRSTRIGTTRPTTRRTAYSAATNPARPTRGGSRSRSPKRGRARRHLRRVAAPRSLRPGRHAW